jgi:hypothetical protein
VHPGKKFDTHRVAALLRLTALRRGVGLALLLAGTRIGRRLFAGFFLAHVVTDSATGSCAQHTVLSCNVAGHATDDSAFQAAGAGNGRYRCQRHQQGEGECKGTDFHGMLSKVNKIDRCITRYLEATKQTVRQRSLCAKAIV